MYHKDRRNKAMLLGVYSWPGGLRPSGPVHRGIRKCQTTTHFPPTPGLVARSDELTRRITPAVEQVRQELFGKTPAPFSSYAETAAWIEQMGEQQDYTIDYRENAEGVFSTTHGSKTRFWQQVQQAWNSAQRRKGTNTRLHSCWQSTERNYARLTRKLAQQVSGTKEPRGSRIICLEGMSLESLSSRRTRHRRHGTNAP